MWQAVLLNEFTKEDFQEVLYFKIGYPHPDPVALDENWLRGDLPLAFSDRWLANFGFANTDFWAANNIVKSAIFPALC